MGRTKKTEATNVEVPEVEEILDNQETSELETNPKAFEPIAEEAETKKELPANVIALMRLYPQYEEIWITPKGFVHPAGVPQYLIKGATLYKNEFYNK